MDTYQFESPVAQPPSPNQPASAPGPLGPPVLLNPGALLWLWALPIGVLLILNARNYALIEGSLDLAQRHRALEIGLAGAANALLAIALHFFAAWRTRQSRDAATAVHPAVGLAVIAVQVAYLWFAFQSVNVVVPPTVATWIYPPERFLFHQFGFAMLPLFLGLFQLACARPAGRIGRAIAVNTGLVLGAPVLFYLGAFAVQAAPGLRQLNGVVLATGAVVLGLVAIAGLLRGFILALHVAEKWPVIGDQIAIGLCALVLPIGGLCLNRVIPFPVDFQAWEVYALVVVNAAILLVAVGRHATSPRLTLNLLCVTLPFSLYFFVVFLPYTPISILAVLFLGAGFLALSPIALLVLHVRLVWQAWRNPALRHRGPAPLLAAIGCALLLPAFFVGRGLADRVALRAALDYVYAPAVKPGDIVASLHPMELRRAIANHRHYKNGIDYPLLSDFYSWLVFDRLVLPDDRIARIEEVFFGRVDAGLARDALRRGPNFIGRGTVRQRARPPRAPPPPRTVHVAPIDVGARPVDAVNTTVTLAVRLENTGRADAEYATTLPLPAGVLVNGFRLHVNGVPVPGRIFEKKTALWVYTMIRDTERRDPGLLFYNNPGELELRVFPIAVGAVARVEIDFLVPAALTAAELPAASRDVPALLAEIGRRLRPQLAHDGRGSVVAGGLDRLALPAAGREPYLHLIVDRSRENGYAADVATALRGLREKFPAAWQVRITLANHDVIDLVPQLTSAQALPETGPKTLQRALPLSGGFALDLALAHAIRRHRDLDLDAPHGPTARALPPRPVFVILSGGAVPRTLALDLTVHWSDLLPGLELYELGANGVYTTLHTSGENSGPLLRLGDSVRPLAPNRPVRFNPSVRTARFEYWSPAGRIWQPLDAVTVQPATSAWTRAVALHLQQQDHARSPGDADVDLSSLVGVSRESGILLPGTSYIVVENAAQWRTLELRERQKLGQNSALAIIETPAPPLVWVTLGFGAWLLMRRAWRGRVVAG